MWQSFINWLKGLFNKPVDTSPPAPALPHEPAQSGGLVVVPGLQVALSWELPCEDGQVSQGSHPERREWSNYLFSELDNNYDLLMTATDIKTIIPKIDQLTRPQRITCLAELMSTVAEYESSWNPATSSKDVNGRSEDIYRANGLFQMNEGDQKVYHTGTAYTYQELRTAIPNIKAGVGIILYMIKMRGKLTYKVSERSPVIGYFFATLLTDGKVGGKVIASAKKRIDAMCDKWVPKPEAPAQTSPIQKIFDYGAAAVAVVTPLLGLDEDSPILKKILVPWWKRVGLILTSLSGSTNAWCANFLDWLINQVGLKGPGSPMAIDTSKWGIAAGGFWFMAPFSMRHPSGGFHTGFFLCWIDKDKGLAAILSGNSGNLLCVRVYNLLGNKAGHDEIYGGLRWGKDWAPGYELTYSEMITKYPQLKPIGMDSNTR